MCFHWKLCCSWPLVIFLSPPPSVLQSVLDPQAGQAPALGQEGAESWHCLPDPLGNAWFPPKECLSPLSHSVTLGAPLQPCWPSTAVPELLLLPGWSPCCSQHLLQLVCPSAQPGPFSGLQHRALSWLTADHAENHPPHTAAPTGTCLRCVLRGFRSSTAAVTSSAAHSAVSSLAADFEAEGFCGHSELRIFIFRNILAFSSA